MAKRPIITTGIALASAGLLVAALPAVAPRLADRNIQVAAQVETGLSASVTDLFGGFDPASLLEGFGLIDGLLGGGLDLDALAIDEEFLQDLNQAWWVGIPVGDSNDPTNPAGVVSGITGVAMVITERLAVTLADAVGLEMGSDEIASLVQGFYVGGPLVIGLLGFLVINDALGEPIPSNLVISYFEGGITELVREILLDQTGGDDSEFAEPINAYFDDGIVGLLNVITGGLISGLFPDEDDAGPETMNILADQENKALIDEVFVADDTVPQVFQRTPGSAVAPSDPGVAITGTFTEGVQIESVEEPPATVPTDVPTDPPADPPTAPFAAPSGNELGDQPANNAASDPPADSAESAELDIDGAEAGDDADEPNEGANPTEPTKYVPPVIAGNNPAKEPNSSNWKKIFDRAGSLDQETAPAE